MALPIRQLTTAFVIVIALACVVQGQDAPLKSAVVWRYRAARGACEIAAYSAATQKLFVTVGGGIDVVSAHRGELVGTIPAEVGFHPTSVACSGEVVAVAWAAEDKHLRGRITVHEASTLDLIATYEAGFLPDMITFTPDGRTLLAANEGEPTTDYSFDPEGSISIITGNNWSNAQVREARFSGFNSQRAALKAAGVHIFGPDRTDPQGVASVACDLEPEFIAVSHDSCTAWITLQENNAIAEVDISAGTVSAIHPLGLKSFRSLGNLPGTQLVSHGAGTGLDVSDQDGGARVRHWPIWGMFQPDGIATFHQDGHDYLVTANEGDPRDYHDFQEAVPIGSLASSGIALDESNPARRLTADEQLGRLEVSRFAGDTDGDGDLDELVCFGTRSFAIWKCTDNSLELVFDSGNEFERILSQVTPERFNADSAADSPPDTRSPIRGPEPENVVLLDISGRRVAVVGLERTGGALAFDISRPQEPVFLDYLRPDISGGTIDLAPEGLVAIPASQSPTGKPLLILSNEGSGTMTELELTFPSAY